jgi:cytochrome P450
MSLASEMKLPELPVEQQAFSDDPQPYIEAARRLHPWLAKCSHGYLVHGYQAIKDMIFMDNRLDPSMDAIVDIYGGRGTAWGRWQEEMVIGRSGPDHLRLRKSVAPGFTPRNVNRLRPLMRENISRLIDEWAPRREFDFTLFASYFPVSVLCGVMGVSSEPIPRIRDALETQGLVVSLNRELFPKLLAAFEVLWSFVDTLVLERENKATLDPNSLLDGLIAAKRSGQMSETEVRDMLIVLFVAGYDTSKNMLGLIVNSMLTRPGDWQRCAEDLKYCTKVVEEQFRHTSITTPPRTVAEEFEYDGVRFPKGAMIFFLSSIAGRDPEIFPDPLEFNPERTHATRHIAFGRGLHMCIGQHLARAQLEEGLHIIAQRLVNPKLAGEVTWRPFLGTWGLGTLPISFEAGPARPPSTQNMEDGGATCPVH